MCVCVCVCRSPSLPLPLCPSLSQSIELISLLFFVLFNFSLLGNVHGGTILAMVDEVSASRFVSIPFSSSLHFLYSLLHFISTLHTSFSQAGWAAATKFVNQGDGPRAVASLARIEKVDFIKPM